MEQTKYLLGTKTGRRFIIETDFNYLTHILFSDRWHQVKDMHGVTCWLVLSEVEYWKKATDKDLIHYKEEQ